MRWMNWMILAAAGISSAPVLAGDVTPRENKPQNMVIVIDDKGAEFRNIAPKDPPAEHQKGAYLGVSSSPAPPVVRKQLGLPEGMGLVVDIVMPESPAATAG